jgi:ribonuclease P protein component
VRYTLKKHEIIRSRKEIDAIFESGSSFFLFPFRVTYMVRSETPGACRLMFAVSRKHMRLATDRNLMRRRMREAYRKNKHKLIEHIGNGISLSVALVFVGREKISYAQLESKLNAVLLRLIHIAEV